MVRTEPRTQHGCACTDIQGFGLHIQKRSKIYTFERSRDSNTSEKKLDGELYVEASSQNSTWDVRRNEKTADKKISDHSLQEKKD